ncbi:hypothetical protein CYMTET_34750 [Cymbomonas tetramitiformis]|uniref:Reverse transcriptase domain-containing protein n=1 Tax=Cymbomonas tetramitiformis TaxID=36881 RepID=A0AAE0KPN0_9CHLO|nr:hypothetical protein CYMTET_34750 [Cymbomonas tetramitiformis]
MWKPAGSFRLASSGDARAETTLCTSGLPEGFHHGVPLGEATAAHLELLEKARSLWTGAWTRATRCSHGSRVFLAPKPRTNKRWLVLDSRWLNRRCSNSKCKVETLKKLRRLARKHDYIFSSDLKDGYHLISSHPASQKYVQIEFRGDLMQCSALPLGWNNTPQLTSGARALTDMGDFPVLCSSEAEALQVLGMVTKTLQRVGIEREEKKRVWQAAPLGEHPGLEVDTASGQSKVEQFRHLVQSHHCPPVHGLLSIRWGGGLNLRESARSFWSGNELGCHITHLELEGIPRTIQTFLQELREQTVLLRRNNQAAVRMLARFVSRNLALMWRMRRLWLLLNLNNIKLAATHTRSEANTRVDWRSQD